MTAAALSLVEQAVLADPSATKHAVAGVGYDDAGIQAQFTTFAGARAGSIYSSSNESQRNIVGERVRPIAPGEATGARSDSLDQGSSTQLSTTAHPDEAEAELSPTP